VGNLHLVVPLTHPNGCQTLKETDNLEQETDLCHSFVSWYVGFVPEVCHSFASWPCGMLVRTSYVTALYLGQYVGSCLTAGARVLQACYCCVLGLWQRVSRRDERDDGMASASTTLLLPQINGGLLPHVQHRDYSLGGHSLPDQRRLLPHVRHH
jgi:hypothetical protein